MYFCKLESVLEFACKSWSICLSPLHLAHEIDVQNYLVLGHFRDYVPIPSHLLLCPPSFFGYKGSSIWPIVASLHICCAVYEVRYRCVCWWVIDTATLKMNRKRNEVKQSTLWSVTCHTVPVVWLHLQGSRLTRWWLVEWRQRGLFVALLVQTPIGRTKKKTSCNGKQCCTTSTTVSLNLCGAAGNGQHYPSSVGWGLIWLAFHWGVEVSGDSSEVYLLSLDFDFLNNLFP